MHHFKADDSNANLVEPEGTALYGGEWRDAIEDAIGAVNPSGEEEIVLLNEINGLAAEIEEKQSGIRYFHHSLVAVEIKPGINAKFFPG